MQQYFTDTPLHVGDEYIFTKEQAHHARDVVRLDRETVRLVSEGKGYFAECRKSGNDFTALVTEEDPHINELPFDVTLAIALIRREKFELVLQKAAELGVSRIVPFVSSRCIVREAKEKKQKQLQRYRQIVQSASEQCKRNRIPEVTETIPFEKLHTVKSGLSLAAYEKADAAGTKISDVFHGQSVTVVIGPEGGFSEEEVSRLAEKGFIPVTLGSRILRAETAALYACAVISEGGM